MLPLCTQVTSVCALSSCVCLLSSSRPSYRVSCVRVLDQERLLRTVFWPFDTPKELLLRVIGVRWRRACRRRTHWFRGGRLIHRRDRHTPLEILTLLNRRIFRAAFVLAHDFCLIGDIERNEDNCQANRQDEEYSGSGVYQVIAESRGCLRFCVNGVGG